MGSPLQSLGFFSLWLLATNAEENPVILKKCPISANFYSYLYKGSCYDLHSTDTFAYEAAVEECGKNGGQLWTNALQNELIFIKKLKIKSELNFWLGIKRIQGSWLYVSDNTPVWKGIEIPNSARTVGRCLAITNEGKYVLLRCLGMISIYCEFTGETCKNRKILKKPCYEINITQLKFHEATAWCQKRGGRLLEIRGATQELSVKKTIQQDRSFENLNERDIEFRTSGSSLTIWNGRKSKSHEECEVGTIHHTWEVISTPCNGGASFVCTYSAQDVADSTQPTKIGAEPTEPTESTEPTKISMEEPKDPDYEVPTNIKHDADGGHSYLGLVIGLLVALVLVSVSAIFLMFKWQKARQNGQYHIPDIWPNEVT